MNFHGSFATNVARSVAAKAIGAHIAGRSAKQSRTLGKRRYSMVSRINPELERLRLENQRLRQTIDKIRSNPEDIPFVACDNSCVIAKSEGMATNGGCRCSPVKLRAAILWYRQKIQFLRDAIRLQGNDWSQACGYCKGYPDQQPDPACTFCWGRG